ncbi:MAG: pyridoxal 5'-phosphate synthase glutaminase subunit PdxT [Nocardioides sp.]
MTSTDSGEHSETDRVSGSGPVGVLALQGDFREHLAVLGRIGVTAVAVRRPRELDDIGGLIIPGGESTAIAKLARIFDLFEPIKQRIKAGMPVLGTCAGMIMLADRIIDGTEDQETFGGLDITVRRNAFGRQVDSFESPVTVAGLSAPVHGVFIRAPLVTRAGPDVEVLARLSGPADAHGAAAESGSGPVGPGDRIVAVRQGPLLATSFHPEVGRDPRIHAFFADIVRHHRHPTGAK